jgi:hypothetical protein
LEWQHLEISTQRNCFPKTGSKHLIRVLPIRAQDSKIHVD